MGKSSLICTAATAFAIGLAARAPAQSAPAVSTGNDLLATCEDENSPPHFWMCAGFLTGVSDTARLVLPRTSQVRFCFPQGATKGQTRDVVVSYLKDNPQERHLPGELLALIAWRKAFPCPDEKSVK